MTRLAGTEQHPHAKAVLGGAIPPEGEPSHAYLFAGPAGSGKEDVAREFAVVLLSEGAADPDNAAARVRSGAHPDLTWVAPTSSAGLLVGDVDEPIVAAASHTPFESSRRVFVVEAADALNDQAANRMLKTLEEPPAFAHLILLTDRPGKVLPTISSRCQTVRFDAPSAERIAATLTAEGVDSATAQACARLGLGDAARARRLALGDGPALRAGAEALTRAALAGELKHRPWLDLLKRAREYGDSAAAAVEERTAAEVEMVPRKERKRVEREGGERAKRAQRRATQQALDHALELVGLWLRDVAAVVDGAPDLAHNQDRLAQLEEDAAGRSAIALRHGQDVVEETRRRFDLNVSEELALEQLAYRLAA